MEVNFATQLKQPKIVFALSIVMSQLFVFKMICWISKNMYYYSYIPLQT